MKVGCPVGSSDESSSRARLRRGLEYLRARQPEAAIPVLKSVLASDPHSPPARFALAGALLRTGDPQAALDGFESLLTDDPAYPGARFGRGLALHALGERTPALDTFRQIVIEDPLSWRAWGSIADVTPYEDERVHAIEGAADALAVLCVEDDAPSHLVAAAGEAFLSALQPGRAVRVLDCGGARRRSDPALIRTLARALYHKGDYQGALAEAERLLELAGDLPAPARAPRRFDPHLAIGALIDIGEVLAAAGVQSFLAAGTLLGFHRSGGPLPHDRDIDLGVLRTPDRGPDIAGILRAHPAILLPRISRPGDRYFGLMHKGVAVDIFLYDRKEDYLVCGLSHVAGDIQWRFTPFSLTRAGYGGRSWSIPDQPERYLAETYGPGWRVPDTGFASAVSSPSLYETDPCARAYYAVIRACRARAAGDPHKAEALLRQFPVPVSLPRQDNNPDPPSTDTRRSG